MRLRAATSGAGAWLAAIGFHDDRDQVLFRCRARVLGADRAVDLDERGCYATPYLNDVDARPAASAPPAPASAPPPEIEPDQPELIQLTPQEAAARAARQAEQSRDIDARQAASDFAREIGDWMAFARFRGETDHLMDAADRTPDDLVAALWQALATGQINQAAAVIIALRRRAGVMGANQVLRDCNPDAARDAMFAARRREAQAAAEPEAAA